MKGSHKVKSSITPKENIQIFGKIYVQSCERFFIFRPLDHTILVGLPSNNVHVTLSI